MGVLDFLSTIKENKYKNELDNILDTIYLSHTSIKDYLEKYSYLDLIAYIKNNEELLNILHEKLPHISIDFILEYINTSDKLKFIREEKFKLILKHLIKGLLENNNDLNLGFNNKINIDRVLKDIDCDLKFENLILNICTMIGFSKEEAIKYIDADSWRNTLQRKSFNLKYHEKYLNIEKNKIYNNIENNEFGFTPTDNSVKELKEKHLSTYLELRELEYRKRHTKEDIEDNIDELIINAKNKLKDLEDELYLILFINNIIYYDYYKIELPDINIDKDYCESIFSDRYCNSIFVDYVKDVAFFRGINKDIVNKVLRNKNARWKKYILHKAFKNQFENKYNKIIKTVEYSNEFAGFIGFISCHKSYFQLHHKFFLDGGTVEDRNIYDNFIKYDSIGTIYCIIAGLIFEDEQVLEGYDIPVACPYTNCLDCDIKFRDYIVKIGHELQIEDKYIEQALETSVVPWKEVLMERAFEFEYTQKKYNHTQKDSWFKIRKIRYYSDHYESCNIYGSEEDHGIDVDFDFDMFDESVGKKILLKKGE